MTKTLEKKNHPVVEPIALPPSARARKEEVLAIRISTAMKEEIETRLKSLGFESSRDKLDFLRGAILAGLTNAERAKSPEWQRFIDDIQEKSKKHLGMGLKLEGAKAIRDNGVDL